MKKGVLHTSIYFLNKNILNLFYEKRDVTVVTT